MTDADATTPEVSIVIPTRNRWALLAERMASVERQTFRDLEVIVVDDASDEPPPASFPALGSALGNGVRVIRLDARSERSAARNRGLASARGDFVLFLDDDDLLRPDALATMVRALRTHERCVAVMGAYVVFDETGSRYRRRHPRRTIERHAWRDVLFHIEAFGSRILFRSDVVRSVGGYREGLSLAEDWDLLLRVSRIGPLLFVPPVVTEYRQHSGQTTLAGVHELQDDLAMQHLSSLPPDDQATGRRIRRARQRFREGDRALAAVNGAAAVRHFASVVRAYPGLLTSPIHRVAAFTRIAKSAGAVVAGGRIVRGARRLKAVAGRRARPDIPATHDAND
jgi:hypothetical protein